MAPGSRAPRISNTDNENGGEEDWERVSQSGFSGAGSASDIGSVCGSVCGDDAALDALANDWALIGPIGEDTPIEGWDSVNDYAVAALSGRSTPHLPDKSLPEVRARDLRPLGSSCPLLLAMRSPGDQRIENSPAQLLCQGPFARRPRPHFKKRGFGPRPAMIAAAAAAAAAPSAQGAASAPAPTDIS